MDVLYYWKNFDADLKANRIGYFKSEARKLATLRDGFPDFIWVIKTPKGRKGDVQVLGKLRWMEKAAPGVKAPAAQTHIYYDSADRHSVQFMDSGTEEAIAAASDWVGRNFPNMLAANFQGAAGQEGMRGNVLKELETMAGTMKHGPFSDLIA